jgi:hypothetical protein
VNFSDFDTLQKLKKSAEEIKRLERDLAKQEKTLAEKRQLAERLGLSRSDTASAEATVNALRVQLDKMKAQHTELSGSV